MGQKHESKSLKSRNQSQETLKKIESIGVLKMYMWDIYIGVLLSVFLKFQDGNIIIQTH